MKFSANRILCDGYAIVVLRKTMGDDDDDDWWIYSRLCCLSLNEQSDIIYN
jgi:hypothetical protein